jgi:hypothetical protein
MLSSLSRKPVLLSLLGAVVLSAPAFATDFSEGADFGGTYSYIGPGVASLPDVDVDVGPLGAGVYVEPGVAFMSPAMDYAAPASTWAPVYPETLEVVAPAGDIDVGPAATGVKSAFLKPATIFRGVSFTFPLLRSSSLPFGGEWRTRR